MAYGKLMLENARAIMEDIDQIHIFRGILESAGIPTDLDMINLNDDVPAQHYHRPSAPEPPSTWDNFMSGTQHGQISQFMIDELAGGFSMMGPSTSGYAPSTSNYAPSTADPGNLTADYVPSYWDPPVGDRTRQPTHPYTPGTGALGPPRVRRRRN
jgi:hypothetical protein